MVLFLLFVLPFLIISVVCTWMWDDWDGSKSPLFFTLFLSTIPFVGIILLFGMVYSAINYFIDDVIG